jgi:hypothetical protein
MNIVEQEAIKFYKRDFLSNGKVNTLENLKSTLVSKLYNFNRDRDKLDFLKILKVSCTSDIAQHMKNCNGCGYDKERNIAIFAIEQEIEDINKYYVFVAKKEDEFTPEEESKLHNKLNKIIEDLEKQHYGQQIIFEEIDELKNHFILGKKNWFQLVKGKFFDLTVEKVIEKVVIIEMFDSLSEGFEQVTKMITK